MRGKKAKAIRWAAAKLSFDARVCKRHLQRHHPNLPVKQVYDVLHHFWWTRFDGGQ